MGVLAHEARHRRRRLRWGLLALLCVLPRASSAASPPVADAPTPDTIDALDRVSEGALIDAALRHPEFEAREQATREQAGATRLEVRRWSNPQVEYTREQLMTPTAQGEDYLTIAQTFDISGRRSLRTRAAERRIAATEHDLDAQRAELVARVRTAYAHTLHAQERERVCVQWQVYLGEAVELARVRAEGGEGSRLDVLRIEQEIERVEGELVLIRDARLAGWTQLRALALDESLPREPSELEGPLAPAERSEGALDMPELRKLEVEVEASQRDLQAARRLWVPSLLLGLGYKGVQALPQHLHGFTATIGLTLPVADFGRADRRRAEATLARRRSDLALTRERLEVEHEGLETRIDALGIASHESSEVVELARTAFAAGEIDTIELLDVYDAWQVGEGNALEQALTGRLAAIELDRLEGKREP